MAEKYVIQLEVDSSEAQKNIEDVNKGLQQTDDNLKQTNKSAKKGKKGFSGLTMGARALGTALKAAGIGLVIAAFTALGSALANNQKVLNTFNLVIGTATQFMTDLVTSVIDAIETQGDFASQFDAIGRIIVAWGKGVIAVYSNVFNSLKTGVLGAQLVWEKSFFGDGDEGKIKELQEGIAEATSQIGENINTIGNSIYTIATNAGEAISEIANVADVTVNAMGKVSLKSSFENTKLLQELTKNSEIAKAKNQGLIEEYDRLAEKQRQIRDNEFNSIEKRIAANDLLKEKLEEQKKLMLQNATVMKDAAALRFKLSGLEADEVKLLEAKNELKAVEAQITGFMSEQDSNANALKKESNQLLQTELENTNKVSIAKKRLTAEEIEGEIARLEALKQIDILEAEQETIRLQAIVDNANAGTQAKIDAQIALDDFMIESNINSANRDQELQAAKDIQDKKEIDDAKAVADAKIEIANKEEAAKKAALNGYASALSGISGVIGQETAAGKSLAIASSLVNTYAAISGQLSAFSKVPVPGYAIAQAIATGVVGFANVKKIASVKIPNSSGGGSSETGTLPSMPSLPEFNIVGQGAGSQIASALGEQQQAPIQAFVVSQDVTTAQSLENGIIQGATLGG